MNNKELVEEYLKKYPSIFTEFEKKIILGYEDFDFSHEMIPDLIREIYDEIGILPDSDNVYLGFIDLLDQEFSIKDKNIVEVGGGVLPRLGVRISHYQTTGSIKVYDERLSPYYEGSNKLVLKRRDFLLDDDLSGVNLIIGFMPCEATEAILRSAFKNKTDFMIALCEGGIHGDVFDYFESDEEWLDSIMYFANRGVEDNDMGVLKTKKLIKYNDPYPVIYNHRF